MSHETQPKTAYGDPVGAVHVVFPEQRWQAVAKWNDTYKCYVIVYDERQPWTPEGARTWSPY